MIWSSLNRLFLTTPALALAGHPKWEKPLFLWATLGEQVNSCHLRSHLRNSTTEGVNDPTDSEYVAPREISNLPTSWKTSCSAAHCFAH